MVEDADDQLKLVAPGELTDRCGVCRCTHTHRICKIRDDIGYLKAHRFLSIDNAVSIPVDGFHQNAFLIGIPPMKCSGNDRSRKAGQRSDLNRAFWSKNTGKRTEKKILAQSDRSRVCATVFNRN